MSQPWPRLLCAGALFLMAQLAHAQYSWIDDKGTRVFSDRAPPASIPASRILKAPHKFDPRAAPAEAAASAASASAPTVPPSPAAAAKPTAPTLAEQEADFRKRAAQRVADDAKAAQEAQQKAAQAAQCAALRRNVTALSSGVRMTEFNAKGEQVFIADDERARRLAQAQSSLSSCN